MSAYEPNKLLKVDKDSIIEEIKRVYFKFFDSRRMAKNDFNVHSRVDASTVVRHFGSWENALEESKIPFFPKSKKRKISLTEMKADLERVKDLNQNKYYTYVFYKQNDGKYFESIIKYFGYKRWEELLNNELKLYKEGRVIEVKEKKEPLSKEQLFNEIKNVWEKFGRRPTYGEFRKASAFGIRIYEKRFGTWKDTVEQFCLENINYNTNHGSIGLWATKELLIQELQKIKETYNPEVLEFKDYKKFGGNYTKMTFLKYFGSWKNALQSVDIKPGSEWNKSPDNELLFDELQKVWEQLGRQPLYNEMEGLSKYSYKLYERKFGGWNKAIHAFVADRENEEEIISSSEIENKVSPDNIVEIISSASSNSVETIIMKTPRIPGTRLRFRVLLRDNFTCQYCGRTTKDGIKLEADHKIAYSKGGETVLDNLTTACWTCNSGKSNMTI